MMKSVLIKDLFREIYKTRGRYISILAIVAIGCGFFAGVKSSCPDMKLTAEKYYQESNLADLHLMSTLGFDDDDIASVKKLPEVRGLMPSYSVDAFVDADDTTNLTVKIISYDPELSDGDIDNINRPELVSGRMPINAGECVLEDSSWYGRNIEIGNKISVFLKSEDIKETLNTTEFKVVGFVKSSNYISFEHGSTFIGDGKLDSFIFVNKEAFALDVYTDVYVTLNGTENMSPFEDEYKNFTKEKTEYFEEVGKVESRRAYDKLVGELNDELDEAKQQLSDSEKEADEEFAKAENELKDAEKQISDGKAEYESGVEAFNTQITNAETEISNNKTKLEQAKSSYDKGLAEYNSGLKEFESQKPLALAQLAEYEDQLSELRAKISEGEEQINAAENIINSADSLIAKYALTSVPYQEIPQEELYAIGQLAYMLNSLQTEETQFPQNIDGIFAEYITTEIPERKAELQATLSYILGALRENVNTQKNELNSAKESETALAAGIESGYGELKATEETLAKSKAQLDYAESEIKNGEAQLAEAEKLLEDEKEKGSQELDEAKKKLDEAQTEYENGLKEYRENKRKAEEEFDNARQEIKDAEEKIKDIPDPEWYVFDREQNPGYSGYQEDAEKVDSIAAVFPFFFVLVAALVCSTTMSRMIEEQRTQIGTLKALGYGSGSIITKYILYAVSASMIGSILGLSIGFVLFPKVIIKAYGAMYRFPEPLTPFRLDYALLCIAVSILCTGITALCVSYRSLKIVPSQLMRPKAPKMGKRVLLERIDFIWKRLSFSHKVTLRNIGRYKKRSLMTIVGIAGCTALILTGFGLRYAIGVIADRQFTKVFVADATVITNDDVEDFEDLHRRINEIDGVESTTSAIYKTVDVSGESHTISANMIVPKDNEKFSDFIILKNPKTGRTITLDESGAVINEKLAKLLNISVGDNITVNISDGRKKNVVVSDISENYALNYVYMTPKVYCELYQTDGISYNCFFLNKEPDVPSHIISEKLIDTNEILGVSFTEDTASTFHDTVKALNSIVWVIILSAGALAFIVMYNLFNINVNERRHELATIKVLGFYDKEVSAYVYRENNISVAIGIILGLLGGIFLEKFVVATAEVDIVMFATDISAFCFVISALLTVLFAAIVTFALHFKLKKISMVESMKAIE